MRDQPLDLEGAWWRNQNMFGERTKDRVDDLRVLPDQNVTAVEDRNAGLLSLALPGHEVLDWAQGSLAERLGVGCHVPRTLDERLLPAELLSDYIVGTVKLPAHKINGTPESAREDRHEALPPTILFA
ncbi:UNVERIFIED_ORG: hypothetical protein ABID33_002247 [Xanthobacter viscosus]|uniref:Uncharacterized protein n=1 Tax=Xanthobacter autotrophicus TaxID=280 RepID=A0A6C1KAM7_XANAU|nr:hypothetical protein [Xanthobacter autotrophicus]TLX41385.1 hypothetical protein FBQ73_18090 [Xanthobacter autotrophicus]